MCDGKECVASTHPQIWPRSRKAPGPYFFVNSNSIFARTGAGSAVCAEAPATFHVRLQASEGQVVPLTEPLLANSIMGMARRHHDLGLWWCELFLVMPDHLHAILDFGVGADVQGIIGSWKRAASATLGVSWHGRFEDHRLPRRCEVDEKWWYVRRNPVARGLCDREDDWRHWWSALSPMS